LLDRELPKNGEGPKSPFHQFSSLGAIGSSDFNLRNQFSLARCGIRILLQKTRTICSVLGISVSVALKHSGDWK
jgi:hypothetical protein